MSTYYSIFDAKGFNVESWTFQVEASAIACLLRTDYSEFGDGGFHVGQLCLEHDEGELGNCPFCHDRPVPVTAEPIDESPTPLKYSDTGAAPAWDLASIPQEVLAAEWGRRMARHLPARVRVLRPCPFCAVEFSARTLRAHIPACRRIEACKTDNSAV